MSDVSLFGVVFVLLDVLDGKLARASETGPTRVGAALDVESDSMAMLFLSLVASRKVCLDFREGVCLYTTPRSPAALHSVKLHL